MLDVRLNTLRPRQDGRLFSDDIFKPIFLNENIRILIKISLKFVPKVPINNISALVQIMSWRRPGDKPLSEPMMVCLLTHICLTRPQWVNHSIMILVNGQAYTGQIGKWPWHCTTTHDDVIKWKHFPRYWPFLRGIHRSPVNSTHKGQWRRAFLFFYLRLSRRLSKQSRHWWFMMPSCSL